MEIVNISYSKSAKAGKRWNGKKLKALEIALLQTMRTEFKAFFVIFLFCVLVY
jgi:hypothetical protein